MLLDSKISELLSQEDSIFLKNIDRFTGVLKQTGIARTHNMIMIDLLFHLLNQQFNYDYINLGLYKKLTHLLNVLEPIHTTTPVESAVIETPAITASESTLDFGNVEVGLTNTLFFDMEGEYLSTILSITPPSKYTVSLDPLVGFKSSIGIIPDIAEDVNTKRVYVKYTPTTAETNTNNLVLNSTGVTVNISCTGTGTITP